MTRWTPDRVDAEYDMQQRGFGDLEAVIMDLIWDYEDPVTVRQIFDELSADRQIALHHRDVDDGQPVSQGVADS